MADRCCTSLLYGYEKGHAHRWDMASDLVGDTGIEPVTSSVSSSRERVGCGLVRGQTGWRVLVRSAAVWFVAVLACCTSVIYSGRCRVATVCPWVEPQYIRRSFARGDDRRAGGRAGCRS
jgi:hypothetical protein